MALSGKYICLALSALLILTGCIRDNRDDCPPSGHTLIFFYPGNGDSDIFAQQIDQLVLYVYDADGGRVLTENLAHGRLQQFQGTTLDLPAGNYTVVCWANADGYTALTDEDQLSAARLYQTEWLEGRTVTDFDPLYYGSTAFYLDPDAGGTDTVNFVSAHINLEVHISGYGDRPPSRASGRGIIELDPVSVGYDFRMDLRPETARMYPVWSTDNDPEVISASFQLLRFADDTPIVIRVLGVDGAVRAEVGLAEFLAENDISVEGINEITVPVYILFRDNGFYVSIDGWHTIPIDPTDG